MDQGVRQIREKNPRENANICSIITFFYTYALFKKGKKKPLDDEDVYEIVPRFASERLGDRIEDYWKLEEKKREKPSVMRVLISCFGKEYILMGLVQFVVKISLIFIQPAALGKLVAYFEEGQRSITINDAYKYAALVIGLNLFSSIYNHNYMQYVSEFGMKVRTSFAALIYRKALKLSPSAFSEVTMGKIVTLITKDVTGFENAMTFLNDMWIGFIETIIIAYIIYIRIGLSVLAGVGFFIAIIPLQAFLGRKTSLIRLKSAKKTDERIQVTKEVFSAIKIVKMYTWEKFFETKINDARKSEIGSLQIVFYLKVVIITIGTLVSKISFYLLIITYIFTGHYIKAETVYFIQSCFINLRSYITISIPIGIAQTAELVASVNRIQKFLNMEEINRRKSEKVTEPKVYLKNVSVTVDGKEVLKDVSLSVREGLFIVTGNVGSGKSSLLKAIMNDYPQVNGHMQVDGTISYASQEPWLFPSTIKQNILFGQPYNEKRYQTVLNVCALNLDLSQLENGDQTIVGDRGVNLSKGQQARINLARAVYKDSDIYLLDDCLSSVDTHVNKYVFKKCVREFLKHKVIILVTHNINNIKQVYGKNVLFMENGTTLSLEQQNKSLDKRITYYMDDVEFNYFEDEDKEEPLELETEIEEENNDENETTKLLKNNEVDAQKKLYSEYKESGKVSLKAYFRYYKYAGGIFVLLLILIVFIIGQVALALTDKLISVWVNIEPKLTNYSEHNMTDTPEFEETYRKRNYILNFYSLITLAAIIFTLARAFLNFYFCLKASKNLHKSISHSVINSFMNFFDGHFVGNIVNRFSKDLATADETIPYVIYENLRCILGFIGIIYLIASVDLIFLIPSALLIIKLYFVRRFYVPTGRSLKRLESATRSPMIGYLNATLEGLTTVRAYEKQRILIDEFDKHQDFNTSAYYMMMCTLRAFVFSIDIICSMFIASIVLKLLIFADNTKAGDVGLAISQAMMLTGLLQWTIRQITELENNMTAVERVLEYADVETENKTEGKIIGGWPSDGKVEYRQVRLTYKSSKELVLKDISFIIQPRQRIGIVGRTGAGKSSIISTLFRLYDFDGKIFIDDVDTKILTLDFLRSNIANIPQDPILFTGTIRSNIDPTDKYSDPEIWDAIDKVNLKQTITSLDEEIKENGLNYSSGQRQLLCLARALISKNKIIILDEATASMDPQTCSLLQTTIKKNFANCTVLTIAHRLNTVVDSDKVMVVDAGEIVEYDTPDVLLGNKSGFFYKMIKESGLLET